jgi:hypothetical protein
MVFGLLVSAVGSPVGRHNRPVPPVRRAVERAVVGGLRDGNSDPSRGAEGAFGRRVERLHSNFLNRAVLFYVWQTEQSRSIFCLVEE